MLVWIYIIVYIHAIINHGYERMFRQLTSRFSYVSFKDFTFWIITSSFVDINVSVNFYFIETEVSCSIIYLKKNEKTRPSMTCKRIILFSLLRISGKICELKNSEKDRGKLVLDACIFCLLLLLPEEFSIRRHSSTRATESISLSFRIDSLRRARVKCKYRVCA